jgi:hypothetical protein
MNYAQEDFYLCSERTEASKVSTPMLRHWEQEKLDCVGMEGLGLLEYGQPAQDIIDCSLQVTAVSRSIHDEIIAQGGHPASWHLTRRSGDDVQVQRPPNIQMGRSWMGK